jgi:hypothetical protein
MEKRLVIQMLNYRTLVDSREPGYTTRLSGIDVRIHELLSLLEEGF